MRFDHKFKSSTGTHLDECSQWQFFGILLTKVMSSEDDEPAADSEKEDPGPHSREGCGLQ
jgi:hypothetical protein